MAEHHLREMSVLTVQIVQACSQTIFVDFQDSCFLDVCMRYCDLGHVLVMSWNLHLWDLSKSTSNRYPGGKPNQCKQANWAQFSLRQISVWFWKGFMTSSADNGEKWDHGFWCVGCFEYIIYWKFFREFLFFVWHLTWAESGGVEASWPCLSCGFKSCYQITFDGNICKLILF